jgi:type II secretory pathway component HofQ
MTQLALLLLLLGPAPAREGDARLSLDFREAQALDVIRLLTDVGGLQVVFDPGLACKLTLKLNDVEYDQALDMVVRSCGFAAEEHGGILRVSTPARLRQDAADRRRLAEERRQAPPARVTRIRLSYARAAQMAPIVKKMLSPRGDVTYDERTNTLILID